ncbi:TonB-dependent receptor [Thalassotalea aquiviva]|uniref:TonB-dependent receptor n=1 Tax=Thalassotalea aquiviva TaxID=3242415 RepID=UPI00352B8F5E
MKNTKFLKKPIAMYVSAIIASGFTGQAFAEEQAAIDENEIEVIEVTGIRSALIRSMDLKRSQDGVVDVISAEDMGKFPDTNLAESLQRITGVTVSRSNGEGSQITVRGWGPQFNLITLNGRQMPGTGYSRAYSLENLSSDAVSALEVHKTAKADNPSGGLGATVNIVTVKPLQSPGLKYSLSGKGIYDESNVKNDDITPEYSALYSNTFADDSIGVAVAFSHQERDFQSQSSNIYGWQFVPQSDLDALDASMIRDNRPENSPFNHEGVFLPRDLNYGIADIERERTNANVTFQYAPVDDVILTLDYTMGEATTGSNTLGWGQWINAGSNLGAILDLEVDENGTAVFVETKDEDGSWTRGRRTDEVEEKSIGFNIDWQATEELKLAFDYHNSESKTNNGGDDGLGSTANMIFGSKNLDSKVYEFRDGDLPQMYINWANGTTVGSPSDILLNFGQFFHDQAKNEVEQFQFDGVWENPYDIPLMHVKFGLAHTTQAVTGESAGNAASQTGQTSLSPLYVGVFPDSMFEYNSTSGFLDEFSNGGNNLLTNYYYDYDLDEAIARSQAYFPAFNPNPYQEGAMGTGDEVEEQTSSIYVSSLWDFEVAEMPVKVNLGMRYEQTDVNTAVLQSVPTEVIWQPGGEWKTLIDENEQEYSEFEGEHDVFLPNLDIAVDITDDLVGRFSWGKSITRSNLSDLAGTLSVSEFPKPGQRTGGNGNANLQPFESTNLDIALEWYYDEGSYAAVGYYRKDVKNFLATGSSKVKLDGLYDPYNGQRAAEARAALGGNPSESEIFDWIAANYTGDLGLVEVGGVGVIKGDPATDPEIIWDITSAFNVKDDKVVDGWEFALQHLIGDTGFGFGVNATIVDGDVEYDTYNIAYDPNPDDDIGVTPQTPLVGLSDSANFQAFYDKDGLSVKVTYAWRDSYLIGVGQGGASNDAPPQYAKEFATWDMSVNYDVDENLTVFFEGINMNNETEEIYGRFEEQFLRAAQFGSRYTLGARYSFK